MSPLRNTIRHALHLGEADPYEHPHFHIGGDGRPFACDVHRCESPGLSAQEVDAAG